jgi:hypothetical protein
MNVREGAYEIDASLFPTVENDSGSFRGQDSLTSRGTNYSIPA